MKSVQGVGILNVILGLIALWLPIKFYSFASAMFTPDVSPPFSIGAVKTITLFLFLPSIVLMANGIALLSLGLKLERVPEFKAFSDAGEYMGRLKGVEIEEGEVEKFELEEEEGKVEQTLPGEKLTAIDDVLIVRKRAEPIGVVRHEFMGKEVYNDLGEYLGKVADVVLERDGTLVEFTVVRGDRQRVLKAADVESSDQVIIAKSNA